MPQKEIEEELPFVLFLNKYLCFRRNVPGSLEILGIFHLEIMKFGGKSSKFLMVRIIVTSMKCRYSWKYPFFLLYRGEHSQECWRQMLMGTSGHSLWVKMCFWPPRTLIWSSWPVMPNSSKLLKVKRFSFGSQLFDISPNVLGLHLVLFLRRSLGQIAHPGIKSKEERLAQACKEHSHGLMIIKCLAPYRKRH